MRTLLLMRGAPGAGKSSWIKTHNLEQYTLCPDELRIMCSSIDVDACGNTGIIRNEEVEKHTWEILFKLLELRMRRGEFTVIDATCSKTRDIQQYKALADNYRYRVYCVDFTGVPLETCLVQNKLRPEWKWVPEEAIRNIYARFATQKIPSGVEVIQPSEFERLYEAPYDLSGYKKVVVVGDIHGCFETLTQYEDFANGGDSLKDDTAYIFCGDYFDRGPQNAEVLWFLYHIMNRPNVCLLEGNHERHLADYGNGVRSVSKEFEANTRPQLEAAGFDEKCARMLYRKVRQFSHFMFGGKEVLACHGGLPSLDAYSNLLFCPTCNFIRGVGQYKDYKTIAETWMGKSADNQILIHGHRNVEDDPIDIADRVYNLEGSVEFGGAIRLVELYADGRIVPMELDYKQTTAADSSPVLERKTIETVEDAVKCLRASRWVTEKALGNDISSFNFTREAFLKSNWTKQTILARGLFIDVKTNTIIARSYEKFFKVDELPQTEMRTLRANLQYPVKAYKKYNGFLALVAYDPAKEDLFIASKSTNTGEHVELIKKQLVGIWDALLARLRYYYDCGTPVTFVFECIDPDADPHIIKYTENHLVLLDVIYNTLAFETVDYPTLCNIAAQVGCEVKEPAVVLKDWEQFRDFYIQTQDEDYTYDGEYVEGFVFEDASGFMVKCKTGYYRLWKKLRGVCDQTLRCGYITKTGMLTSSIENYFYGFLKARFAQDRDAETKLYPYRTDIINMRDLFEASYFGKFVSNSIV